MKVAITGHSKGLGAEFYRAYTAAGHTVTGFSRSNGYDLRDWSQMQKMLAQIKDYDLLISCAKPDFVQTVILYQLWKLWQGQSKTIINISSILTTMPTNPIGMFYDVDLDFYRTSKETLNNAHSQLMFKSPLPKLILVKPGHLYDNPITDEQQQRLTNWVDTFINLVDTAEQNMFKLTEITLE